LFLLLTLIRIFSLSDFLEPVGSPSSSGNGIRETTTEQPAPKQPEYYKAKEPDPNEISPLVMPTNGSKWTLFLWGLVYPIHFMCRTTMPDCRQEKWRSWYPFTFCISMIWISFYSYIMVWMITIIGNVVTSECNLSFLRNGSN
jgi:hypothetical protein